MTSDLSHVYKGASVFVTGDSGFKGSWLVRALATLGARVSGYSLPRDIRAANRLRTAIYDAKPAFVFHLAAQAFVPVGFRDPIRTFEVNVQGTVNVLEAVRQSGVDRCAVVIVTTDKCYDDPPLSLDPPLEAYDDRFGLAGRGHREIDPLGGRCPYSASKASAEHAVAAYRSAFFAPDHSIAVATARAGNVIGGGDWGEGRLVPNAIRALMEGKPIPVYNPEAIRPWQYVEDVIDGYLRLGAALAGWSPRDSLTPAHGHVNPAAFAEAWNFGPSEHHTVQKVVEAVIKAWGSGTWAIQPTELRERMSLLIDSTKARERLGWKPKKSFAEMIELTVEWYRQECEHQ